MIDVRKISLVITTLNGMELEVSTISGRESISDLFSYQILANYREHGMGGITAEDLLGQEADLLIYRNDELGASCTRDDLRSIRSSRNGVGLFDIRFAPRSACVSTGTDGAAGCFARCRLAFVVATKASGGDVE